MRNRSVHLLALGLALGLAAPAAAQTAGAVTPEQAQQRVDALRERNEQVRQLAARVQQLELAAAGAQDKAQRLAAAEQALAIAAKKNRELAELGEAIITDYERLGLGRRTLAREPLTQLYRVKLQNRMQEYRDEVAKLGFYPERDVQLPADPPAAATEPAPSNF